MIASTSRVLIKVGGAQLEDRGARDALATSIAQARASGLEVVLVHGGGNQMRARSAALGLEDQYVDGQRVTDAPTAEVALMVLGGEVNRLLVESLRRAGVSAVGLTGADGGVFTAKPYRADSSGASPLGYVGEVDRVDPTVVDTLLAGGFVPVLATVAPQDATRQGPNERFYNINADTAAGGLAAGLAATAVLFLTDVEGVLDADGQRVGHIDRARFDALVADGTISGGMIPKVAAALATADTAADTEVVKIAPAAIDNAVVAALREDTGTSFGRPSVTSQSDTSVPPDSIEPHIVRTYVKAPEVFVSGRGTILRDAQGREWLDFLGGIAVSALGHAHPQLTAAIRAQAGEVLHLSNLYQHPFGEPAAEAIAELAGMRAVFFTNSGAEANEAALKLARKHQRRHRHFDRTAFVSVEGGFHGRTMGALSVTPTAKYREPFEPLIPGIHSVPRNDIEALEQTLTSVQPAALILEPIQGEGGIVPLDIDYLRAARELCTRTETVLIHDEVQCGSGRTGKFLCAQHAGVTPDVATLAKPIAAGLPMGALVCAEGYHDTLVPGDHGSTFAGGPMVCRAAMVLLTELRNGLLDAVAQKGAQLRAGLEQIAARHPGIVREVRGRGLMQALVVPGHGANLQCVAYGRGLMTNCAAGDAVRLLPPYTVLPSEIDRAVEILDQSLHDVHASATAS